MARLRSLYRTLSGDGTCSRFPTFPFETSRAFQRTDLQPLVNGSSSKDTVPPHELENVMEYYNALTTALSMAVKAAETYDFSFNDLNDDDDDDDDVVVTPQVDKETPGAPPDETLLLQRAVVDWVRTQGGIFNRKQEIRHEVPGDPSSILGVFAKENIKKGEVLVSVPWELVMTANADDNYEIFFCNTARFIIEELRLGDNSFYAPYVRYLLAAPPVVIPSTWSERGKDLLKQIIADEQVPPVSPTSWVDDYKEDCKAADDPFEIQAALQLVTRGDDDTLTPLYDMYNHRNGKLFNAQSYQRRNQKHQIRASRDINKGEQIYISYNQVRRILCASIKNSQSA